MSFFLKVHIRLWDKAKAFDRSSKYRTQAYDIQFSRKHHDLIGDLIRKEPRAFSG